MVRHSHDDGSFPMSSAWDDQQRPICGQKAWNIILTRTGRTKVRPSKMYPLNEDSSYKVIDPPISPCNSETKPEPESAPSTESPKAESLAGEQGDDVPEVVIQEFDPNFAPQARRRRVAPVSLRRASPPALSSVVEDIDEDGISENLSQPKSLASSSGETDIEQVNSSRNMSFASSIPSPGNIRDVENSKEVESMLKSMRDLILQQQQTLSTMGAQNHQYRMKIAAYQDHFLEMRKDGCNQREQIYRLQVERDTFETEAKWLREEMNKLRQEASSLRMKYDENLLRKFHAEDMVTTPRISNTHPKKVLEVDNDHEENDSSAREVFAQEDSIDQVRDSAYPSESRDDEAPQAVEETRWSEDAKSPDERDDQREPLLDEVKPAPEPRKKASVRFLDQSRGEESGEDELTDESRSNRSVGGSAVFYKDRLKQIHMNRARRRETHDCRPTENVNATANNNAIPSTG